MSNTHFYATFYGEVNVNDALNGGYNIFNPGYGAMGVVKSFPSALTEFKAISPLQYVTTGGSQVTIQSVVFVYPQGLTGNGKVRAYVTDSNIQTLNTNAQ